MLQLFDIKKRYVLGDGYVDALKGVSINFRENEFVAILGQSGCGKTTLLNIIGGLDRYTTGDLVINGVSTKQYKDKNWDTYRNHSIGFIFQSYNLIPHQTVLSNVELALTISGVSREERRRRAVEALEKVGLGDQLNKKPNQMSGGQMQRVAIARALVNDPDILLADEPTGALDSQTSVAVMEILKEVAKDKLVIMVTHNPDLADQYATRIVRLKDGLVTDDTNPYEVDNAEREEIAREHLIREQKKGKKTSMSFFTALSLSLKNLMTKKTRTILTSFAGSIGIIGIALILSVSQGFQSYVDTIERDTVSGYPITINETVMDMSSMLTSLAEKAAAAEEQPKDKVYSNEIMVDMMNSVSLTNNNLTALRDFIENGDSGIKDYCMDIKYSYGTKLNTYIKRGDSYVKGMSMSELLTMMKVGQMSSAAQMMGINSAWTELIGSDEDIKNKYDLVYGEYPDSYDEILIIVDEHNRISDFVLYCLGIRDAAELEEFLKGFENEMLTGEKNTATINPTTYTYEEIVGYEFSVLANSDFYELGGDGKIVPLYETKADGTINYETEKIQNLLKSGGGVKLKISGIVTAEDSGVGGIAYREELMTKMIERANNSDVVKAQENNQGVDMFTGSTFRVFTEQDNKLELLGLLSRNTNFFMYVYQNEIQIDQSTPPEEAIVAIEAKGKTIAELANMFLSSDNSYKGNLEKMGYVDFTKPISINIYPKDFDAKDAITDIIKTYNDNAKEQDKITYTDMVATLMGSVTTIVNAVSYVLIAFVSISLVVSSIMIGIITYISVLERTKEIGILRAIGASKRDISRVFNAETIIVGFAAGLLGVVISLLALIPINLILNALTGIEALKAMLPPLAAVILVAISVFLTVIAGFIPSGLASKKDPVIALRSE